MKKNHFLVAALALVLLGNSCKKDEYLNAETKENQTTPLKAERKEMQGEAPYQTSLQKAETKIHYGKPVAEGEVKYQIGLMRTKADGTKVASGDTKFQLSLQR